MKKKTTNQHLVSIPLAKIEPSDYQRPTNPKQVDNIVQHFDEAKLGMMTVSKRDGKVFIIDGAHRLSALRRLDYTHAVFEVLTGLTREEEAEYFAKQGQDKRALKPLDLYKAGLIAGDEKCLCIEAILKSNNFRIGFATKDFFQISAIKRGDDTEAGYNRNRLLVDEPAADVVKMIFKWKLDGQSAEAIANKLNTLGIPSPMAYKKQQGMKFSTSFALSANTKWTAMAVFRILRNETYTGTLVQGKVATPNHKVKKKFQKPTADWARVDGMHQAIIDIGDFNLVQRLLERDTRISPKDGETVYPFSGMARCGLCGENMVRKTSHSNGKAYVYFVCCRSCKGSRIKEEMLMVAVSAALQSHIDNIMNIDRVLRFIDELPLKQDEVQKLDGQIAAKRAEMERYESLVMSLYENLQSGIINETEYRQMKARYNALHADAEQAINSLNREIADIINSGGEKNRWIEQFKEYQNFSVLSRRMVVSLVDVVIIHPGNKMEILFRYRYDFERAVSFIKAVEQLHTIPTSDEIDDVGSEASAEYTQKKAGRSADAELLAQATGEAV